MDLKQIIASFKRIGLSNKPYIKITLLSCIALLSASCTQEQQNRFGRGVQNWTGTNGVLEVYAGNNLVRRFIKIDKISTATGTESGKEDRPYRYGYGILDTNLNMLADPDERKVYFELSDYSTSYIFFENPLK